jgi:hypothetical protein
VSWTGQSHAQLAAALAVDGALATIAGGVEGTAPVKGMRLRPEERAKLAVDPGGTTMFYPIGIGGVYLDLAGDKATVWFNDGDCEFGLPVFEEGLSLKYPNARQVEDVVNAKDGSMRSRSYEVELGSGRRAFIDVGYPADATGTRQFAVRVFAQQRV